MEKTSRGFTVFGRVPTQRGGSVRVQESSQVEGPFVWLFLDDEQCIEHMGKHQKPDPLLNVEQAKALRDALDSFINEASRG